MPRGRFSSKVFPGAVFGKLTVIERIPRNGKERSKIRCRCDCGKETTPPADALTAGRVKSCGCGKYAGFQKQNEEKRIIAVGQVYGRLTVIQLRSGRRRNAICVCECGTREACRGDLLVGGSKKSCGCLNIDSPARKAANAERNKRTAKFQSCSAKYPLTFRAWGGMIRRCYRKENSTFHAYGGKGVKVCRFLKKSPWNFIKLMGVRKKAKPTVDRFPIHDGNYTCGRCKECKQNGWGRNIRWATRKEQSENRGEFNVRLTAFGMTKLKSQWMAASGLTDSCLSGRLKRGWDIEEALTTPDKRGNCYRPAGS